jgi:zinc transport system substrate-binding protein
MRRLCALLIVFSVSALAVTLSNGATDNPPPKLRILSSTFPLTLFTRNITSGVDGVTVESMLPPSMGCPHDYVLTPADMEKISRVAVFVANGLGLEEFLGEPLRRANPRISVIEGSEGVHDIIQTTPEAHGRDHYQHSGANPHLFASPRMAAKMVLNIASALAKLDPTHAEAYASNAASYAAALEELGNEFVDAGKGLKSRRVITQHAVFDYLARDMGLEIVAVVEESPGQEPSAAEMLALVGTIRKKKVGAIFTEPQYPAKAAQTLARETGIPVSSVDPVATGPDDAPQDYYQRVMRQNLDTIRRTLGNAGN